jgi:MFS family permease
MICFVFPYFLLLNTRSPLPIILAIVLALGLVHASFYGPQSSLIAERFSTEVRYTGASLGYQLASISAGGPAPIIATYLMTHMSSSSRALPAWVFIALYIIAMSLISLLASYFLQEYAGKAVADEHATGILSGH